MYTFGFGCGCQVGKVLQSAEDGVDLGEIGNVVAEIGHGRLEDGRQPHNRHSQLDEMVQPVNNS